jgi:hypothetical protein
VSILDVILMCGLGVGLGYFFAMPIGLAFISLTQRSLGGYKGYSFRSVGPAKDSFSGIIVWLIMWGPIVLTLLLGPIWWYNKEYKHPSQMIYPVISYYIGLIGFYLYVYTFKKKMSL